MTEACAPRSFSQQLKIVLEMIKVQHTVFALPFAFMGALMGARGLPTAPANLFYPAGHGGGQKRGHGLQPPG